MRLRLLLLAALLWVGCSQSPEAPAITQVCGVDPDSGTTLWTSPRCSEPVLGPSIGCYQAEGQLVGIDLKDGRELWHLDVPPGRLFLQGDLLLSLADGSLTARDATSPEAVKWTATVLPEMAPVGIGDGVLLVRGKQGLSALEARTGHQLWNQEGDYGVAALGFGRVFAAQSGRSTVEAYSLDQGRTLWASTVGGPVWNLVLADDRTVAVRTPTTVEGLAADSGRSLWSLAESDAQTDLADGAESKLVLRGPSSARILSAAEGKTLAVINESLARRVDLAEGRVFSLVGEPGAYQLKAFETSTGKQAWARNSSGSAGGFVRLAGGHLIAPFEVRP